MTFRPSRVTLDLNRRVADGSLDLALATRLASLAEKPRWTPAADTLAVLGAMAVAIGVLLLEPSALTGLVLALAALALAFVLRGRSTQTVSLASRALAMMGVLGLCGWLALEYGETWPPAAVNASHALLLLGGAVVFRSLVLAALVPVALAATIGAGGGYWHATYALFVKHPLLTVTLFAPAFVGLHALADRLEARADGWLGAMLRVQSRMSFIVANIALWVGSLWGERIPVPLLSQTPFHVPDSLFAIVWALAAAGAMALGSRTGSRFVRIGGIVFLAINAFTQVAGWMSGSPLLLVVGGIVLVGAALAVAHRLNARPATV